MTTDAELTSRTIHEVWAHHNQALAAKDIDEFIRDFSADCVFINNPQGGHASGTFIGPDGVRAWCHDFFALFGPVTDFSTQGGYIEEDAQGGGVVMISWTISNDRYRIGCGVDTFIVQDGQFHIVTVVYDVQPAS
jgi:hypothetical protein